MFGLSKQEKFIKSVEDSMAFLLGFQGEQFVRSIYKHYPNAKTVVAEKMKEGLPENRVASELLRIVLTDQIDRHTTAEQKVQLLAFLQSDGSEPAPSVLAKLCRSYATMMFRESDLKKLDEQWVKDCMHDVYFAAKGMSGDERSNDRMVKAFEEAARASVTQPPTA